MKKFTDGWMDEGYNIIGPFFKFSNGHIKRVDPY